MIESAVVLTPLHYAYLIGVIVILAVMVLKKDTPAVCIAFLFILGLIGLKSVTGGIITVFSDVYKRQTPGNPRKNNRKPPSPQT